jgi:eukaryotic-like serine/threonine-protein kinase
MPNPSQQDVLNDSLSILQFIKDNATGGRSNRLAEVKHSLESRVNLEFDSYFFFLRKFHYIAMDREAQLRLTDGGERVCAGEQSEKFFDEVLEFFNEQLQPSGTQFAGSAPTPPPHWNEGAEGSAPPPPGRRATTEGLPQIESRPPFIPAPPPVLSPLPLTSLVNPQAASTTSAKGQDLDLRYQKFEQIGAGPLGTVFKGKHNALALDVCVKELKDIFGYFSFLQRGEVIKRLKKELCAQAQVQHPAVVQVLDQNTDVARPYFVLELLEGSLRERLTLSGGRGIEVKKAIRYFLQLAYGLRAAHQRGLTHHNLKPENVLFDAHGNVKLADFGLSRVIEVDQSKGMPQVFVGTGGMGYMSPELIARNRDAGASADVYGLGIILYEMLTGQIPGRRSPLPSELNSDCPAQLDPIFDKMTQDRKEVRYADFDAVFADFYAAFGGKEYLEMGDLIMSSEVAA